MAVAIIFAVAQYAKIDALEGSERDTTNDWGGKCGQEQQHECSKE